MELLEQVARPRAIGTVLNDEITDYIGAYLEDSGYEVNKIPFDCKVWKAKESFLEIDGNCEVCVATWRGFSVNWCWKRLRMRLVEVLNNGWNIW